MGERSRGRVTGAWIVLGFALLVAPASCTSDSTDEHDGGAGKSQAGVGAVANLGGTGGGAHSAGREGLGGSATAGRGNEAGARAGAAPGGGRAAGGRSSAGSAALGGEQSAGTLGDATECGGTGSDAGAPADERPACGDGRVGALEQCDDGNVNSGDGCSSTCRVETNFACRSEPSVCTSVTCGDHALEGNEVCDDGNVEPDDGCSPTCMLESNCPAPGCTPVCGDGVASPGEECDDGNALEHDGCTPDCTAEVGYFCDDPPIDDDVSAPPCTPVCGDGLQTPEEECDDGEADNDGRYGGCGPDCRLGPHCGDGVIAVSIDPQTGAPFEQCDDAVSDNCVHCKLVLPCSN